MARAHCRSGAVPVVLPVRTRSARSSAGVVVFPGLGLPRYLTPLARTLAEGGVEVVVFDALAFRGGGVA